MTTFRLWTSARVLAMLAAPAAFALTNGCDDSNPTQPDTSRPRIVSTSPAAGATEVYTTTTIEVVFSKPVDPGTVVILVNGVVRGPIVVNDSIATCTLNNRLFQKVPYTAAVPEGVRDLAGNIMDSAYAWTFTTGFGPLGEEWTQQTSPTANRLDAVVRGSEDFLAVGASRTILTSPDGRAWTENGFQDAGVELHSAFPIGDRYVAAGSPRSIVASTGPLAWTEFLLPDSITNLYDMWVTFDGIYMAGTGGASGTDGMIVKYRNPSDWTSVNLGSHLTPRSIASFGSGYIVVGDSGLVFTSPDGAVWNDHSLGKAWGSLQKVRYAPDDGVLIAVGSTICTSASGVTWSEHTAKSTIMLRDVIWTSLTVGATTHTLYCVVGDNGTILTSQDLTTWTPQDAGVSADLLGIDQGLVPARFVVVGEGGLILTSD